MPDRELDRLVAEIVDPAPDLQDGEQYLPHVDPEFYSDEFGRHTQRMLDYLEERGHLQLVKLYNYWLASSNTINATGGSLTRAIARLVVAVAEAREASR